ncbi:O-methyltransferase [Aspergillus bombycis]|uniref:O-methyltransferase n=1 Tax=Aspergillus bombycis TaxID=109264 RepID=A0A1F8A690_9EURO|nr:O-methyltransferase [Aspergillus bombycis]OGM47231.1 O-methyltransferase [Aspergillus bombycis]
MAAPNRLIVLSNLIAEKTKVISDFLASKGLEPPSFDVDGLADYAISADDKEAYEARLELIAASKELYALSHGPKDHIRNLCWDAMDPLSLHAIWTFRVPQAVPLTGTISYEDLAKKCHQLSGIFVPLFTFRRIVRHAITNRFFWEPELGFVAHNRASRVLLEEETLDAGWPGSGEPNETGINVAYNHNLNWFDHTSRNDVVADRYSKSMKAHGGGVGFDVSHTVSGYPWGDIGEGTVVDCGGSGGFASMAIAEAHPKLNFVVQDQEHTITEETKAAVPQHLKSRVKLEVHDLLKPQTVVADVYFFRWVFHGFAEKYAVQVLRALIPVLKKGAKVVINDGVIPEPGTVPWMEYRSIRCMDLLGQAVNNTGERALDDWIGLFKVADSRFKFLNAWKPPKSTIWFVEAEWQP